MTDTIRQHLVTVQTSPGWADLPEILDWYQRDVAALLEKVDAAHKLLRRYLDNHCANASEEGYGSLCECAVCLDTRAALAALKP